MSVSAHKLPVPSTVSSDGFRWNTYAVCVWEHRTGEREAKSACAACDWAVKLHPSESMHSRHTQTPHTVYISLDGNAMVIFSFRQKLNEHRRNYSAPAYVVILIKNLFIFEFPSFIIGSMGRRTSHFYDDQVSEREGNKIARRHCRGQFHTPPNRPEASTWK